MYKRKIESFPYPDKDVEMSHMRIKIVHDGVNGGTITKVGLRIPQGCDSYASFCSRIHRYEQEFLNKLD